MQLERTIHQLDLGQIPANRAKELGQMGYIQWLGGLRGDVSYGLACQCALDMAQPFVATSPALGEFCRLINASLDHPGKPP